MSHQSDPRVHVCIVCWTGKEALAKAIANAVQLEASKLTVIYSNSRNTTYFGPGNWIKVPDDYFYGKKFAHWISELQDETGLLIQADAQCDAWGELVSLFRKAISLNPNLGLWVPEIEGTPLRSEYDDLWRAKNGRFKHVGLVDGIVWGMRPVVVSRMRELDYSGNNLGWGIEFAAVACSYSQGLSVLRSPEVTVVHKQGSAYSGEEARIQYLEFLKQLTKREKRWMALLRLNHRLMAFARIKFRAYPKVANVFSLVLQPLIRIFSLIDVERRDA